MIETVFSYVLASGASSAPGALGVSGAVAGAADASASLGMETLQQSFLVALRSVMQIFLIGVIGFVAVKRQILNQKAVEAFAKLMIEYLIPMYLFLSMARSFDLKQLSGLGLMLGICLGFALFGMGLSWLVAQCWPVRGGGSKAAEDGIIVAMGGMQNSFFLPTPLAIALLAPERRDEGMLYVGACSLVISFLQWSSGVALLADKDRLREEELKAGKTGNTGKWGALKRSLLSPPLIGMAAGCILSQVPLVQSAARGKPEGLLGTIVALPMGAFELLSPCVGPLAMILLGSVLASGPLVSHLRARPVVLVTLVRLILVPAAVIGAVRGVLHDNEVFLLVLAIEAASPPATSHSIIAIRYSDRAGAVSGVMVACYLIGLLTLPLWISLSGGMSAP